MVKIDAPSERQHRHFDGLLRKAEIGMAATLIAAIPFVAAACGGNTESNCFGGPSKTVETVGLYDSVSCDNSNVIVYLKEIGSDQSVKMTLYYKGNSMGSVTQAPTDRFIAFETTDMTITIDATPVSANSASMEINLVCKK